MRDDFAVFILTHGRADNVKTVPMLEKCGYTGRVIFIVDNLDEQVNDYIDNFGEDNVYVFDKVAWMAKTEQGNNWGVKATITYARNACWEAAEHYDLKYFVQFDDDYTDIRHRVTRDLDFVHHYVDNLDSVFEAFVRCLETTGASTLAMAQGGDFLGSKTGTNTNHKKVLRKAMNSFFCAVDRPLSFLGVFNEDVNTYTHLGSTGTLFFTSCYTSLNQTQTQSSAGGITETYLEYGTYYKAFTTVMYNPSSVKVAALNSSNKRIHHKILWRYQVPKILREKHKKK